MTLPLILRELMVLLIQIEDGGTMVSTSSHTPLWICLTMPYVSVSPKSLDRQACRFTGNSLTSGLSSCSFPSFLLLVLLSRWSLLLHHHFSHQLSSYSQLSNIFSIWTDSLPGSS
jgi:hypothetical protein